MATKVKTTFPKIRWEHEWVAVDLGNNRGMSSSYGGCKSRGCVPDSVSDAWAELAGLLKNAKLPANVRTLLDEAKVAGPTYKDKVAAFVDRIPQMWPEWNTPPKTYTVGESVTHRKFGAGKVESLRGTMVTVRFPVGLVRMAADLLAKHNA